jgi:hypothetical protein
MRYKVEIKNNETGEVRTRDMRDILWHEYSDWWWTEGNFGCDCNRHLEFERAAGTEPDFDSAACGHEKYTAIKAILQDGTEILLDKIDD